MKRSSLGLWMRWSWRDLRRRWLLVSALALVIALGTGAYAGLGGTTAWRISSNDASYALLKMHDLRVQLPDGGFVRSGALVAAARSIPDARSIAVSEERLVVPTQVDASTRSSAVLVPGDIVGMPADAPVNSLYVADGRGLSAGPVLESKFAGDHHLATTGSVVISGGHRLTYVGTGYTPEYFRVVGRSGSVLGETGFAVLFLPLTSAQQITGHAGMVNDMVLRLRPGANRSRVQSQLEVAVARLGASVTNRDDDPVYRGLYADAHNDQQTWNAFALLILVGAAVAAFNLVTRLIDAQRREVGVGMALGVSPRALALRPLLVGVQVAIGGMVAGIGVGLLMGIAMKHEMGKLLPMPVWNTPFQTGRFAQAAALGLAIPIVATILPLWRVLRMQPVDAIRTGAYGAAGRTRRIGALVQRMHLPGRSYLRMPIRNVLRAPRRTALTALGVAAAVTCFVAVVGIFDSFNAAGDRNSAEVNKSSPDRVTVTLSTFYPQAAPEIQAIAHANGVAAVDRNLKLPTRLTAGSHELDAVLEVLDLNSTVWAPTIVDGDAARAAEGIVLSEKAAKDLHVQPGDTIKMRHPVRTAGGFRLIVTPVLVSGVHPSPMRPFAYLDARQASLFGLAGATNSLSVVPSPGTSQDTLLRTLFDRPGVSAVEPASGFSDMLDSQLSQFTGILSVVEVTTLLLALLIAFNTASLTADERAREHATMLAFGLRPRVVTAMAVAENAVIGLVGTLLGIGLGIFAVRWIVSGFDSVMPDLSINSTLSGGSVALTVVLGVLVVALAPLLNYRKQRRMDIPSTLRVVE